MANVNYMKIFQTILIILAAVVTANGVSSSENTPESFLKQYTNTLKNLDTIPIESVWVADDIARSRNLGIKFEGITTKIDCASPLIFNTKYLFDSICKEDVRVEQIDSLTAKGSIDIVCMDGDSITSSYFMTKENGRWWLCSSMYVFTKNWHIIQSKYFKIIFSDSSLINKYAIEALDSFTDSLSQILEIPPKKMEYLQERKIEYYLCTQDQMKLLTGHDAHGMASFPFDAIITRHLPHPHEVSHLMINYALEKVPLFTLPIIQEGLACCLGGRWGKSASIINYWGATMENLDLLDIDSLLTTTGFYSCPIGVDGSYAIGALLVESLIMNHPPEIIKDVYLNLSGNNEYIRTLSVMDIKLIVEDIVKTDWYNIHTAYNEVINQNLTCSIIPCQEDISQKLVFQQNNELSDISIYRTDSTYNFIITLSTKTNKEIILLKDRRRDINANYRSWQFNEQLGNYPYDGSRYGIAFDQGETGLYDYYTNTLKAKYVYGFTPLPGYWNPDTKIISFSLDRLLFDDDLSQYQIELIPRP